MPAESSCMQPSALKLLEDIRDSYTFILDSVAGKTLDEFANTRLLYQAVERNFEIMGEAINRLKKSDPKTAGSVGDYAQIIAFRNILVHGYDIIDREIVWRVIRDKLPPLKEKVEKLLNEAENYG